MRREEQESTRIIVASDRIPLYCREIRLSSTASFDALRGELAGIVRLESQPFQGDTFFPRNIDGFENASNESVFEFRGRSRQSIDG